ncbi:TlpA family protein disulfide reductase [Yeosuana marina]|uniref:TlpA family protein disulfide reductase n=1 Tax=Yeosuana marina TaxID=1565536 RepID=UPI0030C7D184
MRFIQYISVLSFLILFGTVKLSAQSKANRFPEIGKPMPYFELKGIRDYSEKKVSSEGLKGKPYVLYFWSRYCSGAVQSLKKANKLNKKFKDSVNIFLISGMGTNVGGDNFYFKGTEPGIDNLNRLYSRLKNIFELDIPNVLDSKLFQQFMPGNGVPHVIFVDKNGVVQAITYTINENKLRSLLDGKAFFYHDESYLGLQREKQHAYTRKRPFLIDGNGGQPTDFMFRSILANYQLDTPKIPKIPTTIKSAYKDDYTGKKGVLEGWETLAELYKLAYFGYRGDTGKIYKWDYKYKSNYNQLILEVAKDSVFKDIDYETRKNLFVYSLIVPRERSTPKFLKAKMQSDLKSYFSYKVSIEKRKLPYWQITTTNETLDRLKTKGGKKALSTDAYTKVGFTNTSVDSYLGTLLYLVVPKLKVPVINEISSQENIDIPLTNVSLFSFEEIKTLLRKQGFQIKLTEKEFNVIVISD